MYFLFLCTLLVWGWFIMILNTCIDKHTRIIYLNWNVHTIFMKTREYESKSNNNFCNFAAMHKTISMCNWHFLYRTYIHFQMGKCNLNSTYFYLHYNRQTWGHIQNGNIVQYLLKDADVWIQSLKLYNTIFCMLLRYIIKQKDYN